MLVYQYIRDNGGWEQWVMIPIEQYSCDSKNELEIRERYHIDLLRPTLNIVKPGRTTKEYYENNKEIILKRIKQYRVDHNEEMKKYDKKKYKNNKEKVSERRKQYYENNKENVLEKAKKIYENNKEKVICDHCGCEITKHYLNKHQKSKKCINFVKKD